MLLHLLMLSELLKFSHLFEINQFCFTYDTDLVIRNFDQFDNFNLSSCYNNESSIRIVPRLHIILDSNLSIDQTKMNLSNLFQIEIFKLKGIDLKAKVFMFPTIDLLQLSILNIRKSYFNFYNQDSIVSEKDCQSLEIYDSFMSLFENLQNTLSFMDCIYNQKICTFIFKNSNINFLIFNYFLSTTLRKNYLQFSSLSLVNSTLNSSIISIQFTDAFWISLDISLLNDQVFKSLKYFAFYGHIYNIQIDLFTYFDNIELIGFKLNNLQTFVHRGLNWTHYISNMNSFKIKLTLENSKQLFSIGYKYPDEDYCLFKSLISSKYLIVYADLDMYQSNDTNLSCVLISFLVNHYLFELTYLEWFKNCCVQNLSHFFDLVETCQKIECSVEISYLDDLNTQTFYHDFINTIYNLELGFDAFFKPLISIIGILLNVLIYRLIKDNKKDFKEKMYMYVKLSSLINICILLLDFMGYVYECSKNNPYLYCSFINETFLAQYIFILRNFLRNFFEFCSNFTMLFFSIDRSMNLGKWSSQRLLKFLKYFEDHFLILLFSIWFLFNLIKFF